VVTILQGKLLGTGVRFTNTSKDVQLYALDADGHATGGQKRWDGFIPFGESVEKQEAAQKLHDKDIAADDTGGYDRVGYWYKNDPDSKMIVWHGTSARGLADHIIGNAPCTSIQRAEFVTFSKNILRGKFKGNCNKRFCNYLQVPGRDQYVWFYGLGVDGLPDDHDFDGAIAWGEDARSSSKTKKSYTATGLHVRRENVSNKSVEFETFESLTVAQSHWHINGLGAVLNGKQDKKGHIRTTILGWKYYSCTAAEVKKWKEEQKKRSVGVDAAQL